MYEFLTDREMSLTTIVGLFLLIVIALVIMKTYESWVTLAKLRADNLLLEEEVPDIIHMEGIMIFGNYRGVYQWVDEEQLIHGKLADLPNSHLVIFQGKDLRELERKFIEAIYDYIDLLTELDK